jgi:histidinol-phosphate aminotransferase
VTNLSDLPLRDSLKGKEPYGAPQLDVAVALNVNENTHQIPQEVAAHIVQKLSQCVATVNRYPDREFLTLRQALANYLQHGLTAKQIWAANGSNEVIQQIFQAFGGPGRKALSFEPTYSMYSIIAQGTDTQYLKANRGERYELPTAMAVASVLEHQPDIVLICSPNNPTGTPVALEVIEQVYAATAGIVIVDEAYAEFAPKGTPSALTLLRNRPRLLVSRTMSKAFAFAGARVGYLAADEAVIDALRLVRLPYHLSSFTQAAAEAALDFAPTMLATVADIRVQKDRIISELEAMGLDPYRSDSNFVLFGGLEDAESIWQKLLDRGILVRNVGIPKTLRVSAGTEAETTAFLDALRTAIAN